MQFHDFKLMHVSSAAVLIEVACSYPVFGLVLELIQPHCDVLQKSECFSAVLALLAGSP